MKDLDSPINDREEMSRAGNGGRGVIGWAVVTAVIVTVLVLMVWKAEEPPLSTEAGAQGAQSSSADLQQIRRIEDSVLSSYARPTSDTGAYRISIQRAMELIASESITPAR